MGNKFMPLLIVLLLLIIFGVGVLAFMLLSPQKEETETIVEVSTVAPTVEISVEYDENKENAKIILNTYTEDGTEIKEIKLPDGSTVAYENTDLEFTATQNGEYSFTVIAVNGQSTEKTIIISDLVELSATNPYMPDGFKYLGGSVESGYVIEDDYGNQYVWIPVKDGKLQRETKFDRNYEESSTAASELSNSVAKYYGFYIARFEASQYEKDGAILAASMSGKSPWVNINYQTALEKAKQSANGFGYGDYKTALISSYAWDTTLEWINNRVTEYSSSTNYGNYSGTVYPTGNTTVDNVNNICDLAGNVREWTTEIYKNSDENSQKSGKDNVNYIYRVIRGGSANLIRTPGSHIGYDESTSDDYWGFRMVLYK